MKREIFIDRNFWRGSSGGLREICCKISNDRVRDCNAALTVQATTEGYYIEIKNAMRWDSWFNQRNFLSDEIKVVEDEKFWKFQKSWSFETLHLLSTVLCFPQLGTDRPSVGSHITKPTINIINFIFDWSHVEFCFAVVAVIGMKILGTMFLLMPARPIRACLLTINMKILLRLG